MEQPSVSTKIRDPEREVTYDVRAYRTLTREELVFAVQAYRRQNKRSPKKGSIVVITTIIGLLGLGRARRGLPAIHRGLHTVSLVFRQHLRPLRHRRRADLTGLSGRLHGAAQDFDSFGLVHAVHVSTLIKVRKLAKQVSWLNCDMSTLIERLQLLMTENNWGHADLVRISGQSSSVVSQWLGKSSKVIKTIGKLEAAEALAKATGCNALWIAKGIGPRRPDSPPRVTTPGGPTPAFTAVKPTEIAALPLGSRQQLEQIVAAYVRSQPVADWRTIARNLAATLDYRNGGDLHSTFVRAVEVEIERRSVLPPAPAKTENGHGLN